MRSSCSDGWPTCTSRSTPLRPTGTVSGNLPHGRRSRRVCAACRRPSPRHHRPRRRQRPAPRRGDLWVASVNGLKAGSASIVHKLQLVSGRGLSEARPADAALPVRVVDLAVTPDGTVLALDAVGPRLFRLRPGARTLELAYPL